MNEVIVSEEFTRAFALHKKIKANVQCAKETFLELGRSLKEMRDGKLYKELGYQNFEEYCEVEAEIGRSHGYRMIQIVENLPEDFVSSMGQIGTTKLTLLAMLDPADREEIQQTVNVEETSVRELKSQIDALKAEKKQAQEELEVSKDETKSAKIEAAAAKLRAERLSEQIGTIEEQVKELESRPIVVATSVEAEEEAERLRGELKESAMKLTLLKSEHKAELDAERQKHVRELAGIREENDHAIAEMREEYEGRIRNGGTDRKAVFKAYLANAIDAMTRLSEFVNVDKNDPEHDTYCERTREMLIRVGNSFKK